ncbi:MAG: carboxypeptidase regulatory-like domain-containing protein [Propionibacteriaceae bacterium]|nr:carboxypeptidase regulatory-like domain-containing protein [Propionibacteriaceae bacterium]
MRKYPYPRIVAGITAAATALAVVGVTGFTTQGLGIVPPAQAVQTPAPTGQVDNKTYTVPIVVTDPNDPTKTVTQPFGYWLNGVEPQDVTYQNAFSDPAVVNLADHPGTSAHATGFVVANVLPGDNLVWYGDMASNQNPQNASTTMTGTELYTSGVAGLWSVGKEYQSAYSVESGPTPEAHIISQSTDCGTLNAYSDPNSAAGLTRPGGGHIWWDRWCMGPAVFQATLNNVSPITDPLFGDLGYFDVGVDYDTQGGSMDSGPEYATTDVVPPVTITYRVVNPSLLVVKQVCSTGTGCDPNDDPATPDMATRVDTEGEWVDAQMLPEGTTDVQWRITAFNTGSVDLSGISVASDTLTGDPVSGSDNPCGTLTFPNLPAQSLDRTTVPPTVVTSQASQTCTTTLTGAVTTSVVNSAQLKATFSDTIKDVNGNSLVDRYPDQTVLSNTDDATITEPVANLKITKWVCGDYTGATASCTPPTGTDTASADARASLGGVGAIQANGTYAENAGAAPANSGWVKEAKIPYGSTAQWLLAVTNTGNVPMNGITINDQITTAGHGASTDPQVVFPANTTLADLQLAPGQTALLTLSTSNVTNPNAANPAVDTGSISHGEPTYATGSDVVNTVTATGTAVDPVRGGPLVDVDGNPVHRTSNDSNAEVNAKTYAVGDYVWNDSAAPGQSPNGIQDAGEPGVAGVTVHLVQNGQVIKTTTTNANGYYWFDDLAPGTYSVQFELPNGYMWTTPNAGTDVTVDSDAVNPVGTTDTRQSADFTLGEATATNNMVVVGTGAGEYNPQDPRYGGQPLDASLINPTIDAGIVIPNPGVDIQKYDTLGDDGQIGPDGNYLGDYDSAADPKILDPNTPTPIQFTVTNTGNEPLVNIDVSDRDGDGTAGVTTLTSCTVPTSPTPTTIQANAAKVVHWDGPFAPGATITCAAEVSGMPVGSAHTDTASVTADGQYSGVTKDSHDDWNGKVPSYAVGDYVWVDSNGNGIQDATEAGIPGVTVTLNSVAADGTTTQVGTPTTTDQNGYYLFDMLPAGTYQVEFTLPNGYTWTQDHQGTNPAVDSNADATGKSETFVLGGTDPNEVPTASQQWPYPVQAENINPTIDAGVIAPTPGLKLTKWVCSTYDANNEPQCQDPTSTDVLSHLSGWNGTSVVAGEPYGGWVKSTTVPYGSPADWILVATNTGDTYLSNVSVTEEYSVDSTSPANGRTNKTVTPLLVPDLLAPGESAVFETSTASVTNTNAAGSGIVTAALDSFGEPTYQMGDDLVNTAQAKATPEDVNGNPVPSPTGGDMPAVPSNESQAEANTISYAVGDYMWIDSNRNGLQDAGEAPLPGMTVSLLHADGSPVIGPNNQPVTTTTNDQGYYLFDMLPAGQYRIGFTKPAEDVWTKTGNDGPLDSDANVATGLSQVFTLGPTGTNMAQQGDAGWPTNYQVQAQWINPTIDAGVYTPAPGLKLTKWVCSTGTGCADPSPTDLATLAGFSDGAVTQGMPAGGWVKETTVPYDTAADWIMVVTNTGTETIADLTLTDDYIVSAGAGDLTAGTSSYTGQLVNPGDSVWFRYTTASVTNTGWSVPGDDGNTSNVWGEPTDYYGTDVVNSASATGTAVVVNPPGSLTPTTPVLDANGEPVQPVSNNSTAEVRTDLYAIGDYVWVDANGNGLQDKDEAGVPGATVNLLDSTGKQIDTTTTDDTGYYYFDKLLPGDYQVEFILPDGYMWTQTEAGDVTKDSDANHTDQFQNSALSKPITLGPTADNVERTDALDLPPYAADLTASYLNPTVDAGVILVAPQIDLDKYVCQKGTGCADPLEATLASISLDNPTGGWVKATTVAYNTSAQWLIVIQNTGNVPLANVDLTKEDFSAGGTGFTNNNCVAPSPIALLNPGQFMTWMCTIDNVTNTADLGSGKDIINTAQAEGTPVDNNGNPIVTPGGTPWGPVETKPATAEVNAQPQTLIKSGGSVVSSSSGLQTAGALILGGLLIVGVAIIVRRRRTD